MPNTMVSDGMGSEQLFVLRMLQLSSRRTAEVEQRVEKTAAAASSTSPFNTTRASPTKTVSGVSDGAAARKAGVAKDGIVMGTVLLSNGEASPKDGGYNVYRPRASASSSANAPAHITVEVPSSSGTSPAGRDLPELTEMTNAAASPTSAATLLAKDAEPVSPQSPMRRMLDIKGARPVRRPRGSDVIAPHRRSDSDGASSSSGGIGLATPGRGSRADAAKAALQREVVRRTLSSLGLPVSADVGLALQRRRAAGGTIDSPTTASAPGMGRGTSPAEEIGAGGSVEWPAVSPTQADADAATVNSVVEAQAQVAAGVDAGAGAAAPAPVVSEGGPAVAPPLGSLAEAEAAEDPYRGEKPTSPAAATTFSAFLQRLCAAPNPAAAPAAAPGPTPLSYDTDANTDKPTTATTPTIHVCPRPSQDEDGGHRALGHCTPLLDRELSSATFSGASEKSALSTSSMPQTPLLLPPPPPPPYAEVPLPRANVGAGTFTTAQGLVGHVRLAQRWTILALRRWHRPHGAGAAADSPPLPPTATASGGADGSETSATDLPMLYQRQPSSLLGRKRCASCRAAAAAAAVAAMCGPLLQDGEATLVSDRVDAVLPAWAFLASHAADSVSTNLASSWLPQTMPLASEAGSSASSTPNHRSRRSRNSSFGSSVASVPPGVGWGLSDGESVPAKERLDREACIFPYELAEACALGRLRRGSRTRRSSSCPGGSLHLLRLEFLLDVQHIPPTIRSVSAEERQALLEHALEDFTDSGVLPTTVLRSVLNDAALRLLSSVDAVVLRRIAGDDTAADEAEAREESAASDDDDATPSCAHVAPLSLQVHTVQGDLSAAGDASSAAAVPPARSLTTNSVHSAGASTTSGDADSLWPISITAAPATPTQLIITVLVHVSGASSTSIETLDEKAAEVDDSAKSAASSQPTAATPPTSPSSASPRDGGAPAMTNEVALEVAQVVLSHLFPLPFALSRYATKLAVSSEVNYDALCSASDGSPEAAAAEAEKAEGSSETEKDCAASPSAPQPWTWVDVSLAELRTSCGMQEQTTAAPPAAAIATADRTLYAGEGIEAGAAGSVGSEESSSVSLVHSSTRRSKKTSSATAEEEEEVNEEEPQGGDVAAEVAGKECETESVDVAGISDGQLRWDVAKETASLTAAAEAMQRHLDAICSHAQAVGDFTLSLEAAAEAEGVIVVEKVKTRPGHARRAARQAGEQTVEGCEAVLRAYRMMLGETASSLASRTLREVVFTAKSDDLLLKSGNDGGAASLCSASQGVDSADSGDKSSVTAPQPQCVASCWFTGLAEHLTQHVCAPLERLEAATAESTSSTPTSPAAATIVSVSVGEPSGSISDGIASSSTRHVVGAQVVVKETRRQRRTAAARAAASAGGAEGAMQGNERQVSDTAASAAVADVQLSSLVPALLVAKAMVRRCHEMSDALTSALNGGAKASAPTLQAPLLSQRSATPAAGVFVPPHDRTLSSSSWSASVRMCLAPGASQSLQDEVTIALAALQAVESQMEAKARGWALVPPRLACLAGFWPGLQALLSEEAAARQQLHTVCASEQKVATEAARARLAAEAAVPEEEEPAVADDSETASPKQEVGAAVEVVTETPTAAAPPPAPAEPSRPSSPPPPQKPTSPLPPAEGDKATSPAVVGNAGAEAQQDGEPEEKEEDALQTRGSSLQTKMATEPVALTSPSRAKRELPPLILGADGASRGAPQLQSGKTSDNSTAGAAANNAKKLRNRNKPPLHPSTGRSSNAGSPLSTGSNGGPSFTPRTSTVSPTPTAAAANPAVAPLNSGNAQAVRQAPKDAAEGFLATHVDVALIRQAAPFMALGTALFFLFLLL